MQFDFSKLLGRIKECGFTQETLAREIGMTKSTMSQKLNNKAYFTLLEMAKIQNVLGIAVDDMGIYFFARKVQKNGTEQPDQEA